MFFQFLSLGNIDKIQTIDKTTVIYNFSDINMKVVFTTPVTIKSEIPNLLMDNQLEIKKLTFY